MGWRASGVDGPTGRVGKYGPQVEWNGRLWGIDNSGYYRHARGELLHRAIWEFAHGPIPVGMEIHHKDGNRQNYDAQNLELVTRSDHTKHHPRGFSLWGTEQRRINGRASWVGRQVSERICEGCGVTYHTISNHGRWCSRACGRRVRGD